VSLSGGTYAFLTRHIKNFRGSSQPILAEASDGLLYIVKFTNNVQGANVCFNEGVGNELYRAFGLTVPSWKPLLITDSFLDQNPGCWMQTPEGRLRPESDLCFGSRFLGCDGERLLEILPGTSIKRVRNIDTFWLAWMIDICAEHADNRQALFLEDSQRILEAFFIDHGHLFGGPNGEFEPHLVAPRYLDPRIYQSVSSEYLLNLKKAALRLDVDQLWQRMQTLPNNWKTVSALNKFDQCLCRFSNGDILQSIINLMVETQRQANRSKCREQGSGQERPCSVLCAGIQTTKLEHGLAANGTGHPACA
jgi:hypothetical protein